MDLIPCPLSGFTGLPDGESGDSKDFTCHKQTIPDIFSITPLKYLLFLIIGDTNTVVFEQYIQPVV